MKNIKKFKNFLESLKGNKQDALIESIKKGFNACFEARDYLDIGPSPAEEDCVQLGDPDYREKAIPECRRFIDLIRKKLGNEPAGAKLAIKANNHDFGTYHEVVCYYDDEIPESEEYAFNVEANAPTKWEDDNN